MTTRYQPETWGSEDDYGVEMLPDTTGEWVRFEDHEVELKRLRELKELLRCVQTNLSKGMSGSIQRLQARMIGEALSGALAPQEESPAPVRPFGAPPRGVVVWPDYAGPNVTCPRCKHRHPMEIGCEYAAELAAKAKAEREGTWFCVRCLKHLVDGRGGCEGAQHGCALNNPEAGK